MRRMSRNTARRQFTSKSRKMRRMSKRMAKGTRLKISRQRCCKRLQRPC